MIVRAIKSASVFASWTAFLLLAVLSLVPGEARPHTGYSGHAEHFVAYFLTALSMGIALATGRARAAATLGLSAAAGAFELLQNLSPGRGPAVSDWLVSSAGAVAGMATISLVIAFVVRFDFAPSEA